MKKPFEHIVIAHAQTVLRVCRLVVGVDGADDAWSETFIAAMRAYPELPGEANVEAWLVTIAHRQSVEIVRARQRGTVPTELISDRLSGIEIPGKERQDMWDSVRNLPPNQRHAVAYHYLVGLPHSEVAKILGGTVDAARRAATDGIASLSTMLPVAHSKGATDERKHQDRPFSDRQLQ